MYLTVQIQILKAYVCFYETRQKIFRLHRGKIEFEFWPLRQCWAVGPIAQFKFNFPAKEPKDFLAGFIET